MHSYEVQTFVKNLKSENLRFASNMTSHSGVHVQDKFIYLVHRSPPINVENIYLGYALVMGNNQECKHRMYSPVLIWSW